MDTIHTKWGSAVFVMVLAFFLFLVPSAQGSWSDVESVLMETYGPDVARECGDYYRTLNIKDNMDKDIIQAIRILADSKFPPTCPRDYLRMASELSLAGIELGDMTRKIQEAVAKKVSPERLIRVLEQRKEALKNSRILVIELEESGVEFLSRQMAYTVFADYLLRGVSTDTMKEEVSQGKIENYPALGNLIR